MEAHFFLILTIHKPSLGSRDVPLKIGPDQFSRLLDTNKQKSKLYIEQEIG